MSKTTKVKSMREAMTAIGKAADTKLDEISRSVKKHEKDIADIKKMVREIKSNVAKISRTAKASTPKKAAPRKVGTVKRKAPAKRRKQVKRRK